MNHEGHADNIWDTPLQAEGTPAPGVPDNERQEINANILNPSNLANNIARVCAEGFKVENDNKALPKNIPALGAPAVKESADGLYQGQTWGWNDINKRAMAGEGFEDPLFKNSWLPHNKTYLQIFTHFLPLMWLETVLLPKTSKELERAHSPPLTLGELMQYIGMRLLMSTLQGWITNKCWCYDHITKPRVMAKKRFQAITNCLIFTDVTPPSYCDKFWQVRQMIKAWNEYMANIFITARLICLNESMSI